MTFLDLVPAGPVSDTVLAAAEAALVHAYGYPVRRLPPLPDIGAAYDAGRRQWNSSLILGEVARRVANDTFKVLGVTEADLFIPMLNFVFGQAQLGGRAALVSSARLKPEFYGISASQTLLFSRMAKETIHEMGHAFGLVHCKDPGCPMSLSTTIRQVDQKGGALCGRCLVALKEMAVGTGRAGSPGSST